MAKKQDNQDKNDFCENDVTKALLGIQKDTLETLGKILGKMGVLIEKVDNIEEKLDEKDKTSVYLRFIAFLIITNAIFAGIQVGQLIGLWTKLFGF